ncbi:nucleotidyltransferase family protein [Paenibacillus sp. FSL W8-0426]|uniref:nucleotidyltransferase family protein n=1 Tax=Paenibacillus sp. FSL W8-0426 TaxID=2921714 RepID=UPI0030DAEDF3
MSDTKIYDWLQGMFNYYAEKFTGDKRNDDFSLRVLLAITNHKLEGRINIADLLKMNNSQMLTKQFIASLMFSQHEIKNTFQRHLGVMQEIFREFDKRGLHDYPILIKGFSVFGLTRNNINLRRSADIDLIYSDPQMLEYILIELNFQKDEFPSEHEYCRMIREDAAIEIHKYVSIIDYSEDINQKKIKAYENNRKIFFEYPTLKKNQIYYDDLIQGAQLCDHLGGVIVPDIHYQIFILCTHVFRNFVNSQFLFASHIIIAELFDIVDLLNHESFHLKQFNKIIEEKEGLTSVRFVGYLIDQMFGIKDVNRILEYGADSLTGEVFPKILQFSGAMYIPSKSEEYIYYGIEEFVNHLGTEPIILNQGGSEVRIQNINKFNSHSVRLIDYLSVKVEEKKLNLIIKFNDIMPGQNCDVFEIFIEDKRCCFIVEDHELRDEEKPEGCSWTLNQKEYILNIKISDPLFIPNKNCIELAFVLGATRWGTGPLTTLIPFRLLVDHPFSRAPHSNNR